MCLFFSLSSHEISTLCFSTVPKNYFFSLIIRQCDSIQKEAARKPQEAVEFNFSHVGLDFDTLLCWTFRHNWLKLDFHFTSRSSHFSSQTVTINFWLRESQGTTISNHNKMRLTAAHFLFSHFLSHVFLLTQLFKLILFDIIPTRAEQKTNYKPPNS